MSTLLDMLTLVADFAAGLQFADDTIRDYWEDRTDWDAIGKDEDNMLPRYLKRLRRAEGA